MKILIDNGHGLNTSGKRSPDGTLREAIYNREIARKIVLNLVDRGYDAELLVPEDDDIALSERVRRINAACFLLGKRNVSKPPKKCILWRAAMLATFALKRKAYDDT